MLPFLLFELFYCLLSVKLPRHGQFRVWLIALHLPLFSNILKNIDIHWAKSTAVLLRRGFDSLISCFYQNSLSSVSHTTVCCWIDFSIPFIPLYNINNIFVTGLSLYRQTNCHSFFGIGCNDAARSFWRVRGCYVLGFSSCCCRDCVRRSHFYSFLPLPNNLHCHSSS